jgi:hypothetical protein
MCGMIRRMFRLQQKPASAPVRATSLYGGNFVGVQTADCFHKVWATVPITPMEETDEDVKAERDAAHAECIYNMDYMPAPYSGQFMEPLDAAQMSALFWLQEQVFPGCHDANWFPWPRALRDAFMHINLTRTDIWMLASFFWNIGADPYHVVLWFSTRGAFPRFAGPGEDATLAAKRDVFMEIYKSLGRTYPRTVSTTSPSGL